MQKGRERMKKIPQRQCVGCGEMKDKKAMMRVIRSAEGEVMLDMTGRKNGRGAYLCRSADCLQKARKNRGLEKSLRINIPEEIYENLEKEYEAYDTE